MDIKLGQLNKLLNTAVNTEVRFRIEGESNFRKDFLESYSVDESFKKVTLNFNNIEVGVNGVSNVSCDIHEEHTNVWVYGDTTPRIEINIPFDEAENILM